MTIETDVPGDPASIDAAAESLNPTIRVASNDASSEALRIRIGAMSHWFGTSGDAYGSTAIALATAGDEARDLAHDGAEKLRSYANRLERMQSDFAQHRTDARAGGLTVVGTIIQAPTDGLGYCPGPDAPQADLDSYDVYLDEVELYNEIATDVGEQWGELITWVTEDLQTFLVGIPQESAADRVLDGLSTANSAAVSTYLGLAEASWKRRLADLEAEGLLRTQDVTGLMQEMLDHNKVTKDGIERAIRELDAITETGDAGRAARRIAKGIPVVGLVIEGLGIHSDLESGRSPSSIGVEVAAGGVGGALVAGGTAALIAAGVITAPAWVPIAAGVAGAVAIGGAAVWAYEEWVPQDIRENIDAGINDAWDATTDFAEDAWENTTDVVEDAWENTTDAVGNAWKSVFG